MIESITSIESESITVKFEDSTLSTFVSFDSTKETVMSSSLVSLVEVNKKITTDAEANKTESSPNNKILFFLYFFCLLKTILSF